MKSEGMGDVPSAQVNQAPSETVIVKPELKPKEEAPKETPPKEPSDPDIPEELSSKSPEAKEAFKKFKEGYKKMEERVRLAEEKLSKQAKPDPMLEMRLKELEAERDSLSKKIKTYEVTNSAELQTFFKKKYETADKTAERIVGAELAPRIKKLLRMEESDSRSDQIDEIISELPASKQAQVGALILQYDQIRMEREQAIADAEANAELIIQKREQEATESKQRFMSELDAMLGQLSDPQEGIAVYQKREGDDAWNQMIEKQMEDARILARGDAAPEDVRLAFALAAAAPTYHKLLHQQGEQIQRLTEQVKQLHGGQPTVSTRKPTTITAGDKPAGGKFSERVKAELGEAFK